MAVTNVDGHYTPGYAQFLDDVRLFDASGSAVPLERLGLDRWRPASPLTAGAYRVAYRVRVDHVSKPNDWGLKETPTLGADSGLLIGAAIFVLPRAASAPGMADPPTPALDRTAYTVRWQLPTGWRALAPWPAGDAPGAFEPASTDDLLDNFVLLTPPNVFDVYTARLGNATVTGAIRRGAWQFTSADLWSAFDRTIRGSAAIFGGMPHPSYLLVVDPWPGTKDKPGTSEGGGAARQSFHAMLDEKYAATDLRGMRPLKTLAHETFHWWNPSALPPATASDFYWWHEGVTVYYETLLLWRAGVVSDGEFVTALAQHYDKGERRNAARPATSLVEASRKIHGDGGPEYDEVYDLGAVTAFALDLEIRQRSGGAHSLDDLLRALATRYERTGRGFSYDDLMDEATLLAGSDLRPFFARYVDGHEPFDWPAILAKVGYAESQQPTGRPYLGVTFEPDAAAPTVKSVQAGAPAESVLAEGDVILKVGGTATPTVADYTRAASALRPGDMVTIAFRRNGAPAEARLAFGDRRELRTIPAPGRSADAAALLDAMRVAGKR